MELYAAVRRSVYVEGLSERAAARRFGLARETVRKMLRYRLPPGYRRAQPIRRPKLDAFTGVIDQILREDQSDYVFASPAAMRRIHEAFIWPNERGSDHCPVGVDIDL